MRVIFRTGIAILVIGALLSGVMVFAQIPRTLTIVSNAGQMSNQQIDRVYLVDEVNATGPPNWNQMDFDDSSWHNAIPTWRHNAWCINPIFDPIVSASGDWIWYNNYTHTLHHDWGNGKTAYAPRYNGTDYDNGYYVYGDVNDFPDDFLGGQTLFVRKDFCIPLNAYNISGNVDITADDGFEFFTNGNYMGSGNTWTQLYSFGLVLQTGKNVIAAKCYNINLLPEWNPTNEMDPAALIYKAEISYDASDVNLIPVDIYYADGSLHAIVKNTGSDNCPPGAIIRFYENGTMIGDQVLGTVIGGGENTVSIPWYPPGGDYDICVAVDVIDCLGEKAIVLGGGNIGRIDETNEKDNNTLCKTVTVYQIPPAVIGNLWGINIKNIELEGTFAVKDGREIGKLILEKGKNEIHVDVYNKGILKAYNVKVEVLDLPWGTIEISPEVADIPKRSIQTYTVSLDIPDSAPSGLYIIKIEAKGNFILETIEVEIEIQ